MRPAAYERLASSAGASVAPSRTAATGGTRVGRRAGRTLASSVIPIPIAMVIRTACLRSGRRRCRRLERVPPAERRDHDRVAEPVVLRRGRAAVDDDLRDALGPGAGLQFERCRLWRR